MHPGSGPSDRHNDVFFPPIREHLLGAGIAVSSDRPETWPTIYAYSAEAGSSGEHAMAESCSTPARR
jgi:hypothetical protein